MNELDDLSDYDESIYEYDQSYDDLIPYYTEDGEFLLSGENASRPFSEHKLETEDEFVSKMLDLGIHCVGEGLEVNEYNYKPPKKVPDHTTVDKIDPKPNRQIQTMAVKVYDDIIVDLIKESRGDSSSFVIVNPNLIGKVSRLMSHDFTPSPIVGADHIKKSTKVAMLSLLNDTMYHNIFRNIIAIGAGKGYSDCNGLGLSAKLCRRNLNKMRFDLVEPLDKILGDCREFYFGKQQLTLDGKNYHCSVSDLTPDFYDFAYCKDSFQFLCQILGGCRPGLDGALRCLADNGILLGSYPNARSMTTIEGPHSGSGNYGSSASVKVISITIDHDPEQITEVLSTKYVEPFVDPHVIEEYIYFANINAMVVRSCDFRRYTHNDLPSVYNPNRLDQKMRFQPSNEIYGWHNILIHKRKRILPRSFRFSPTKTFNPLPHVFFTKSLNVKKHNVRLAGGDIVDHFAMRKIIDGGPYFFSEKTDGYPCSFVIEYDKLSLYCHLGYMEVDLGFRADYKFEGQCELVGTDLYFISLHEIDDVPVTFGYGLTVAYHTTFKNSYGRYFTYKINYLDEAPDHDSFHEGMVITDYLSPPPPRLTNKNRNEQVDVLTRWKSPCIKFTKRIKTVDLNYDKFRKNNDGDGIFCIGERVYKIPWSFPVDLKHKVIEFPFDGGVPVRIRFDKTLENDAEYLDKISYAKSYSDVTAAVHVNVDKYSVDSAIYNDFLSDISELPFSEWTVKHLVHMSITYPRGLIDIPNKNLRDKLERYRLAVYFTPLMSALADYPETNDRDRVHRSTMRIIP